MTSEEKVKRVYPDAFAYHTGSEWRVLRAPAKNCLAASVMFKSWAWADAWRRIQAERKGER